MVGDGGVVGAGHAGNDSGLHEAGEVGEDNNGTEDALGVELAVEVDLALDDVAREVCGKR